MYDLNRQDLPTEPLPQATPPKTGAALSTVWAAPVLPKHKREIRLQQERISLIFLLLSGFLVAMMVVSGIYSMPDGSFSEWSFYTIVGTLVFSLVWMMAVAVAEGKAKYPAFYDSGRVNEIFPQGAVSISATGRVVIPFDEVTALVENGQWIALYGNGTEIVWSAGDLTPTETETLFATLATYLPGTVFLRKKVFRPAKPYETPLPMPFDFEPVTETIRAAFSVEHEVKKNVAVMMKKSVPLFSVASAIMANVLCDSFDMFYLAPLGGRIFLAALGWIFCAGVAILLVTWEQIKRAQTDHWRNVRILVSADTVRVEQGANFTVIPKRELHFTTENGRRLLFPMGEHIVTISYEEYVHTSLHTIFN